MSIKDDIITIRNGLVILGDALENLSVHAEEPEGDNRIINSSKTIKFVGNEHNSIYGKGMLWSGYGNTKMFVFRDEPDRIWSSNSIDLHTDAFYAIDNLSVLSKDELGPTVKKSNLRSVGILNGLAVNGNVNIDQSIFWDSGLGRLGIGIEAANGQLSVASNYVEFRVHPNDDNAEIGTWTNHDLKIQTDNTDRIVVKSNGDIVIGNLGATDKKVNIHGKLGVGVNSIAPDVTMEVGGAVKIQGKRFSVGSEHPSQGTHSQGDITWNINPTPGNFVGWICTRTGTPGEWKSFGTILN
jgi:hypothetical protein